MSATPFLLQTITGIAESIPLARIDRVWVFAPRIVGEVESGLVVLALMGEEDVPSDQREVVTVQYELRSGKGAPPPVRELTPRGWAPADRVPAMIDGVVRRLGGAEQEPRSATIRGEVERWNRFVDEVSDGKVDLANGE